MCYNQTYIWLSERNWTEIIKQLTSFQTILVYIYHDIDIDDRLLKIVTYLEKNRNCYFQRAYEVKRFVVDDYRNINSYIKQAIVNFVLYSLYSLWAHSLLPRKLDFSI